MTCPATFARSSIRGWCFLRQITFWHNGSDGLLPRSSAQRFRRLMFLRRLQYRSRHRALTSRTCKSPAKPISVLSAIWRNTYPTNLTGSPALCIPCGFTEGGLPISLQLIGRNFDELTLLQVGHRFQLETDWHSRTPPPV